MRQGYFRDKEDIQPNVRFRGILLKNSGSKLKSIRAQQMIRWNVLV